MHDDESARPATALALFLASAGMAHFAVPRFYDSMIPRELPGKARHWTYGSGVAEIAVAVAVAAPRTRRVGALLAALLFVAVLPGNVKMAVDYHRSRKPLLMRIGTVLRLPAQLPLVAWALRVRSKA